MKNKPTYQELEDELKTLKAKDNSQSILDIAGVIFIGIDTEGNINLANKKACEILGYSENEILGKNWFDNFLSEETKLKVQTISKKILSGENDNSKYFENYILTKSGEERLIHWHNTPILDKNNKIIGHLSSGEDITERRKAKDELIKQNKAYEILNTEYKKQNTELKNANKKADEIGTHLKNENTRFQKTLDTIDAVIYVADIETYELLYLNELGKKNTGNKIGQKCYIALQKGQTSPCAFCTNHLLLDENNKPKKVHVWEFQNTITGKWYQCRDQAIPWTDGRLVRIEIATDITEIKELELQLKEQNEEYYALNEKYKAQNIDLQNSKIEIAKSNEKYRIVADYAYDWEYWINPNGDFIYVSPSCERITGYTPEEFYKDNKLMFKIIHPDDLHILENHKHSKDVEKKPIEFRIITKSKKTEWIGHVCTSIIDKDNKHRGIRGSNRLISKRKKTERELILSNAKYKNIINNLNDVFYRADATGKVTMASPSCLNLFGYSNLDEVIGQNINILYPNSNERAKFVSILTKTGYVKNYRTCLLKKDGTKIFVETTASIIQDSEGNYAGVEGIVRDITDRKLAEKALTESENKLRESNAEKDKFFSIIAHDLKSPFNSILGFSDLLVNNFEEYDTKTQKEFIGYIDTSAKNTYKLLENLLLWSRSQRGNLNFIYEKENLYLLLTETINILKPAAINKGIQINVDFLQNIYVIADKNSLSTIFRNLINNAIKFTPNKGKILINAETITNHDNKEFIKITIIDNGVGIAKEKLSKLFTITGETSTKGTNGEVGTGLGLILCKEFVVKNGGEIWVESEVGKGSKFIFTIPKA